MTGAIGAGGDNAGTVGINPIIYAETSLAFADTNTLDRHLDTLMLVRLPLPYGAAFGAGRAFIRHRRTGGMRSPLLPGSPRPAPLRRRGARSSAQAADDRALVSVA